MSNYKVDGWNNFCRVFEAPKEYSRNYCTGGGIPTNFQMVDWFNPVECVVNPAVSKSTWTEMVGKIEVTTVDHDELGNKLITFLSQKNYIQPGRTYLILCDFDAAFMFTMPF